MGSWNESIYGNDLAQDFLGLINDLHRSQLNLNDIITNLKNHHLYEYNEAKLVLADFEMDLSQNISNKQDVKYVIKEELDIDTLSNWTESKIREKEINKFNNKFKNYKNPKLKISNSDIRNWLKEKRGIDIL